MLFEACDSEVLAEFNIVNHLNAELFDNLNFAVEHFFRKSVLRNTVAEHTAHFFHHIIDCYIMTFYCKLICSCKTCRTAAYDSNFFACCFCFFRNVFFAVEVKVSGKSL